MVALLAVWHQPVAGQPVFTLSPALPVEGETETSTCGVWADFDNDGDLDFAIGNTSAGDSPLFLYRNLGGAGFELTRLSMPGLTFNVAWADFNRDGNLDLGLSLAESGYAIWQGDGTGTFVDLGGSIDVSAGGRAVSLGWADYDLDGWVDLLVGKEAGPPFLLRNNSGQSFSAVTGTTLSQAGGSYHAAWADIDNDGFPDLFLAGAGRLFRNLGTGSFATPVTMPGGRIGVWGDFNNDGFQDLVISGNGTSRRYLYLNNGDGTFTSFDDPVLCFTSLYYTHGGAAGDVDNDGDLDLVLYRENSNPAALFLLNRGDASFEQATNSSPVIDYYGVSAGFGDYDRDGDLDLLVTRSEMSRSLCVNQTVGGNWLLVQPRGDQGELVVGAAVFARATIGSENVLQMRQLFSGGGRWSGGDAIEAHFGMGDATEVTELIVRFPSGVVVTQQHVAVNQIRIVSESPDPAPSVAVDLPVSPTFPAGLNATLTVSAAGSEPLAYGWFKDGVGLTWEAGPSLTLTNALPLDSGAYWVVVTNSFGAVTSRVAQVTVEWHVGFARDPDWPRDGVHSQSAAFADYDGDGWVDLCVAVAGVSNLLYRNQGNGSFQAVSNTPITAAQHSSIGLAWADFDNDGDWDLFGSRDPGGPGQLFVNTGNGTFAVAAADALVVGPMYGYQPVWGDFDNDGLLDLFVSSYGGPTNVLCQNLGSGRFRRVADGPVVSDAVVNCTGAAWGDYNGDGFLDLFVSGYNGSQLNFLYRNEAGVDFTRVTNNAAGASPGSSLGVSWGDYDNDGDLDLLVARPGSVGGGTVALYRNDGGDFSAVNAGSLTSVVLGHHSPAWGDFDNDGDLDVFLATSTENCLFRNEGEGVFTRIFDVPPATDLGYSHSATWADVDRDGDLDLYVANISNQDDFFYRNSGSGAAWLEVELVRASGQRGGIGAVVRALATINGQPVWQMRQVGSDSTHVSQSALPVHFGFGDATNVTELRVEFPGGVVVTRHDVPVDQFLTVTEEWQGPPVVVTQPPLSVPHPAGSNWVFAPIVLGGEPLNYQWFRDGVLLSSGDQPGFTLTNPAPVESGSYWVVASNRLGVVTSRVAQVVVEYLPRFVLETNCPPCLVAAPVMGAGWADYNRDGHPDLFLGTDSGYEDFLFENAGDGTFRPVPDPLVDDVVRSGYSGAWGDFDNDGWVDLFVADASAQGSRLYRNDGAGGFALAGSGPIHTDSGHSLSASWADYDRDGYLDLYVANTASENNWLFRNLGDGTFAKVAGDPAVSSGGQSWSGVWIDYDENGWLDLHVSNSGPPDFLFQNNQDGTFSRVTTGELVSNATGSAGTAWGDYDNDGDFDLFVGSATSTNRFYRNEGGGTFVRLTNLAPALDSASGDAPAWLDYDNDGDLDLLVACAAGSNFQYRNNGDGTFTKVSHGPWVTGAPEAVAVAVADYDGDGSLDVFAGSASGNHRFYRNQSSGAAWLRVLPQTVFGAPAIGANVRLEAVMNGRTVQQVRRIAGGADNLRNQDEPVAHFGLADATNVTWLQVEWPDGRTNRYSDVPVRQLLAVQPPLRNDQFHERVVITNVSATLSGSNVGATKQSGEPYHGGVGGKSVWWEWRPPVSGFATVSTSGSGFDTTLGVYVGGILAGLGTVGTDDDGNGDGTSRVEFWATAGTPYAIAVDGYREGTNVAEGNIQLSVEGNARPVVDLVSPANGTLLLLPVVLEVRAEASDPFGAVERVEVVWDGQLIDTLTAAPYTFFYTNPPVGEHSLAARAYDFTGLSATSSVVTLNVRVPNDGLADRQALGKARYTNVWGGTLYATAEAGEPNVLGQELGHTVWYSWTAPHDGGALLTVTGEGFGPVVGIHRMQPDGAPPEFSGFEEVTSGMGDPTLQLPWLIRSNATYYIGVDGRNGGTGTFELTVASSELPKVSILQPLPLTVFVSPGTVVATHNPVDNDGTIDQVELYRDGQWAGSAYGKPWAITNACDAYGVYTFLSVATDNLGFSSTSAPVRIIVRGPTNRPPETTWAEPASDVSFQPGEPIRLAVNAVDGDGGLARVELRSDGTLLTTLYEAPYQWVWRGAPLGVHTMTATAVDLEGAAATSAARVVTVAVTPPDNDDFADRIALVGTRASVGANTLGATRESEAGEPVHGGVGGGHSVWWSWTAPVTGRVRLSTAGSDFDTVLAVYRGAELSQLSLAGADDNGGVSGASLLLVDVVIGDTLAIAIDGVATAAGGARLDLVFDQAPAVMLTSPADGAAYVLPAEVPLAVLASDAEGPVERIEWYAGTTLLHTSVEGTTQWVWTNATAGTHVLRAAVVDGVGQNVTSAPVTVVVSSGALGQPVFRLGSADYSVDEGAGSVTVTILKSTNSTAATVNYATADGSARAVSAGVGDYQAAIGSLSFTAAETFKTVVIRIEDDASYEGTQAFRLVLANPGNGGALGSPSSATINITDNDLPSDTNSVTDILFPGTPPAADNGLRVVLEPAASAGRWRLKWDTVWRSSGATLLGLTEGNYAIEFQPVPGYLQPADQIVAVSGGGLVSVTNQYSTTFGVVAGSLRVRLEPAAVRTPLEESARAQWRIVGEEYWRESGEEVTGLPAGDHGIEFKAVSGYAAPGLRLVRIEPSQRTEIGATYVLAGSSPGTGPSVLSDFGTLQGELLSGYPYAYAGQLLTDVGYGTGFVAKRRVVLTAAHVVFNDASYTFVDDVWWFFQRHKGEFEPVPQPPRGWYVFSSYAAQREADGTPGVSSPASQNLDAAALYFLEEAGRGGFGGYVVSTDEPNSWLLGSSQKLLVGYPMEVVPEADRGRMHRVAPANYRFEQVEGQVYQTYGLKSFGGNSGGPLCVLHSNGRYYPAAIYLGGSGQTIVRAIDAGVVDLINRADVSANTGDNNVGGGVGWVPPSSGGSLFAPGYLRVLLSPPEAIAAGAGWRLLGSGQTNYVNDNTARFGLLPATYTVEFRAATGYGIPTNRPVTIVVEQTAELEVVYELSTPAESVLTNLTLSPANGFTLSLQGSSGVAYVIEGSTNLTRWDALATNLGLTNGVWQFRDPSATGRPYLFYRGRTRN